MRVITRALTGAATLAIIGGMSATAYAQDAAPADDSIVVTGIRASLESAQERKRTADAIVDSIVADDIGKLPDSNTTEALQRISGIQISRDRGEGGSVAIRGRCRESRSRRSEEHTSELQSLMRISYAVFCLKKKITLRNRNTRHTQ